MSTSRRTHRPSTTGLVSPGRLRAMRRTTGRRRPTSLCSAGSASASADVGHPRRLAGVDGSGTHQSLPLRRCCAVVGLDLGGGEAGGVDGGFVEHAGEVEGGGSFGGAGGETEWAAGVGGVVGWSA